MVQLSHFRAPLLEAGKTGGEALAFLWTHSSQYKQIRNTIKHKVTQLIKKAAKTNFYSTKVAASKSCKEPFKLTGSLMGTAKNTPLPPVYPTQELARMFSEYLSGKITAIRTAIDNQTSTFPQHIVREKLSLSHFCPVYEKSVRATAMQMSPKTCEPDSIPISLVLECFDEIGPAL